MPTPVRSWHSRHVECGYIDYGYIDCRRRVRREEGLREMAMQLDPVLLEVLACPAEHHAPLVVGAPGDPQADALTCTECGRVFPVRDGIPVLLLDEVLSGPDGAKDGSAS